jgi:hypothetical protein
VGSAVGGPPARDLIRHQSVQLMQHRFVVALQIVVESANVALEYGDLPVDENSPVNPDLHFDSQLMHLYVMTEKKVRISAVHHINCWHRLVQEQCDGLQLCCNRERTFP